MHAGGDLDDPADRPPDNIGNHKVHNVVSQSADAHQQDDGFKKSLALVNAAAEIEPGGNQGLGRAVKQPRRQDKQAHGTPVVQGVRLFLEPVRADDHKKHLHQGP